MELARRTATWYCVLRSQAGRIGNPGGSLTEQLEDSDMFD